jgi:hypothetical protein
MQSSGGPPASGASETNAGDNAAGEARTASASVHNGPPTKAAKGKLFLKGEYWLPLPFYDDNSHAPLRNNRVLRDTVRPECKTVFVVYNLVILHSTRVHDPGQYPLDRPIVVLVNRVLFTRPPATHKLTRTHTPSIHWHDAAVIEAKDLALKKKKKGKPQVVYVVATMSGVEHKSRRVEGSSGSALFSEQFAFDVDVKNADKVVVHLAVMAVGLITDTLVGRCGMTAPRLCSQGPVSTWGIIPVSYTRHVRYYHT